jgi:hypothetical protein
VAGKPLVARPPRFRPLGSLPAAPAPKAPPRRPIIHWPAVALAAAAGALLVSGVTLSLALFAARPAKPTRVALAQPPASEPAAAVPEDATALPDAAPSLAPRALSAPSLTPADPDPVPPPDGRNAGRDDPPAPAAARPHDAPPAAPTLAPPAPTCQTFNTSVAFAVSPAAAQQQAARDGKLVFLLHVSGDFEDDAFT